MHQMSQVHLLQAAVSAAHGVAQAGLLLIWAGAW